MIDGLKKHQIILGGILATIICGAPGIWALFAFQGPNRLADLSNFGQFVGGIFAPIAFVWLVVTVFLQKQELELQREELTLNRRVMEQQAEEMKVSATQAQKQTEILNAQFLEFKRQRARETIESELEAMTQCFNDIMGLLARQSIFTADNGGQINGNIFDASVIHDKFTKGGKFAGYETFIRQEKNASSQVFKQPANWQAAILKLLLKEHEQFRSSLSRFEKSIQTVQQLAGDFKFDDYVYLLKNRECLKALEKLKEINEILENALGDETSLTAE
jgi:hypothetical protein